MNTTSCKTILGSTIVGFGFITFCFSFYIAWNCWLRERFKEMILDYCCCGLGEYVLGCWEFMGWIDEKEDLQEKYKYAGLTIEQIGQIKKAEQINKIRLEEAVKINLKELQKSTVKNEEEIAVKDDSPSGTPRRRVFI